MLATYTDQYQKPNSFSVDTDGLYFTINNSANGGICNIKSMFVGDFEQQIVTLVTAYGRTTTMKQVGTIRLDSKMIQAKPGHMTFLMLSMIQNLHKAYQAFLFLANTLLEMTMQMKLTKPHGYNLHQ
jgi:hypothetical protein